MSELNYDKVKIYFYLTYNNFAYTASEYTPSYIHGANVIGPRQGEPANKLNCNK